MPQAVTDDPIAQLRERIRSTAAAADRLAADFSASGEPGRAGRVSAADEATAEAAALARLVALLRDAIPEELRQQLLDLVRQVLLLLRAILDRVVLALEVDGDRPEPVVEDIPVA